MTYADISAGAFPRPLRRACRLVCLSKQSPRFCQERRPGSRQCDRAFVSVKKVDAQLELQLADRDLELEVRADRGPNRISQLREFSCSSSGAKWS